MVTMAITRKQRICVSNICYRLAMETDIDNNREVANENA